jgi:hypothetical protein
VVSASVLSLLIISSISGTTFRIMFYFSPASTLLVKVQKGHHRSGEGGQLSADRAVDVVQTSPGVHRNMPDIHENLSF